TFGHRLGKPLSNRDVRLEFLRRRHFGHLWKLVVQAFLRDLERGDQVEDRLTLLARHDAPVGEAATVEVPLDAKLYRMFVAAAAKKIGVKRMGMAFVGYRPAGGDERLRESLAPEHAARPLFETATDESIAAARVEVEQQDQLRDQAFGSRRDDGRSHHGHRLARPDGASQLMPGIRLSTRQANAFPRLRTGQRCGARGFRPRLRSQALSARASASAKLHSLRQVIDSEIDGNDPFFT